MLGSALANLAHQGGSGDGLRTSLSPRERAGVRGNASSSKPARQTTVGAVKLRFNPTKAGRFKEPL
jgi:hypothetical protein